MSASGAPRGREREAAMDRRESYTRFERELESGFRVQVDLAETSEEVRAVFERTARDLLFMTMGPGMELAPGDVRLAPDVREGFLLSERLRDDRRVGAAVARSDLWHILRRLAGRALRRMAHIERHPERTEAKMFPVPGRR